MALNLPPALYSSTGEVMKQFSSNYFRAFFSGQPSCLVMAVRVARLLAKTNETTFKYKNNDKQVGTFSKLS